MLSTKGVSKNTNERLERLFTYAVSYDYQMVTSCYDRDCDGICRCGVIEDLVIESVDTNSLVESFLEVLPKKVLFKKDLDTYVVNRIFTAFHAFNTGNWYANVTNGYYGEEVDSVSWQGSKNLWSFLDKFIEAKNTDDRVRVALEAEYGHILPSLQTATFKVQKLPKSQVLLGNEYYAKKVQLGEFTNSDPVILGLVNKLSDKTYRLVDGYHRVLKAKDGSYLFLVASSFSEGE